MAGGFIISEAKALPRDIDVVVNISKPQAETTTDFSVLCFATPGSTFAHDAGRIRYYSSLTAVEDDFDASSEAYKAASNFFSQSPRAKTMAIGKIFTDPVAGFLQGGTIANKTLEQWKAVTNGSFGIAIDGVSSNVTNISFATIVKLEDIATVVQTAIRSASGGGNTGFTGATVTFANNSLTITSGSKGETSTVAKATTISPASGTDISGVTGLNIAQIEGDIQPARAVPGYTPNGIAGELAYINEAAMANRRPVYAWALDAKYRDSQDCITAAQWAEGRTALLGLVTNSPFAYDASSTTDVGYVVNKNGNARTMVVYHDNPFYYPEVAILAYALSVNYAALDSTITTKFKDLRGIPTVPMTESELTVLIGKRINTFTLVGNQSRTFRDGTDASPSWFIDDLINLDNFKEELQVSVYNVFLQNKKVPYNVNGIGLLYTAIAKICNRYVKNGTLSDRPLSDVEIAATGFTIDPAYTITFTPLGDMTTSDRAKRVGPPANVKLNLAGAIHSIAINVEAFA